MLSTTSQVRQRLEAAVGSLVCSQAPVAEHRACGRRDPGVCRWRNEEKAVELEHVICVVEVIVEQNFSLEPALNFLE